MSETTEKVQTAFAAPYFPFAECTTYPSMNSETSQNANPGAQPLIDPFARPITYLRVSVTDRCDLRCVYCMAEDMTFLPKREVLSLEELDRLCSRFVDLGVRKLRLTGGAARSQGLRGILSAAIKAPVRVSAREEAGAAGAAMMAAVAIGAYPDMQACVAEWVTPLLGPAEAPDPALVAAYDRIFPAFTAARQGLVPAWDALAAARLPSKGD